MAYPHGEYSTLTNVVLKSFGVKVTLSTVADNNTIIKGLPQSLYALNRYNISENVSSEMLMEYLESK